MFSLQTRQIKCLIYFTSSVWLFSVFIRCLTDHSIHIYQTGRMHKETRNLMFLKSQHRTVSLLTNLSLDNTLKLPIIQKKDKTPFKTSSPFIDPIFRVGTLSSKPSKHSVDHVILFLESPNWFKNWFKSVNISQCLKYTNCIHSFDISLYKSSSAVVFNLPETGADTVPPLRSNPDQAWVFFTLESPQHINPSYNSRHWHNVFNWSWTYHPEADIFHPYGVLVKQNNLPQRNYSNIFRMKTKYAAWVVSNCNAPSERNEYVEILQQFVDVDVFGLCGRKAPDDLEMFLSENYKFYLGFENSLCENYITEKFFHYYKLDVITVLRGHSNYKEYLPNGSYINTADFSSISALARFMKDLGENEEKYVSYLKIKDKYNVYEREFLFKDALCNLCEKVNNIEKNRKTYEDIYKWLGPCFAANDLIVNLSSTFDFIG